MKPPIWWAIWLLMCVVAYGWNVSILRGYKVKYIKRENNEKKNKCTQFNYNDYYDF